MHVWHLHGVELTGPAPLLTIPYLQPTYLLACTVVPVLDG